MGKVKSWFSSKGMQQRKKGMYKKESKQRKCLYAIIFATSAIIYFVCGSMHAARSANANKIGEEYPAFILKNAYDSC